MLCIYLLAFSRPTRPPVADDIWVSGFAISRTKVAKFMEIDDISSSKIQNGIYVVANHFRDNCGSEHPLVVCARPPRHPSLVSALTGKESVLVYMCEEGTDKEKLEKNLDAVSKMVFEDGPYLNPGHGFRETFLEGPAVWEKIER